MATQGAFARSVRSLLREQLLDAARDGVISTGWSRLRMADIAAAVGVSRQTVYNEFGTKTGLGDALVLREADAFLDGVAERLDEHPDDLGKAIEAAVEFTLTEAAHNPLLEAVLTATRGGATEMLPFLTTRSEPILTSAKEVVLEHLDTRWPQLELSRDEREVLIESIVRLVVSHLVLPLGSAAQIADQLAWLARRVTAEPARLRA